MSLLLDLHTQRLKLVPILPASLRLSNSDLSRHLAVQVPGIWPPEHWEPHVFDFFDEHYAQAPHTMAWNRYVVVRSPTPVLIGTIGGFLKSSTNVEVGYSLLEPWRGQGLATEALAAVLKEILSDNRIQTICAQTFPHLLPSVRVLEKSGFQHIGNGEEEGSVLYRLHRETFTGSDA
jgi:[ribosomal protein S5]-alanine N-acetyltransferase